MKKKIKFCGIDFMGHQNSVKERSVFAGSRQNFVENTSINYRDKSIRGITWAPQGATRNQLKQV